MEKITQEESEYLFANLGNHKHLVNDVAGLYTVEHKTSALPIIILKLGTFLRTSCKAAHLSEEEKLVLYLKHGTILTMLLAYLNSNISVSASEKRFLRDFSLEEIQKEADRLLKINNTTSENQQRNNGRAVQSFIKY